MSGEYGGWNGSRDFSGAGKGVALPGNFLRGPYTRCQKLFPPRLTLTLSPVGGRGDKRKEPLANAITGEAVGSVVIGSCSQRQ